MFSFICKTCNKPFDHERRTAKFCSKACYFSNTTEERFFEKVVKSDNPNSCWLWTGFKNSKGYGTFRLKSKIDLAHRYSYKLHKGEIPDGMCVCHTCDNPECCNPNHLWLGTIADNMRDRDVKGRGSAKLTESDVLKIRELVAQGNMQKNIAKDYGIVPSTVHQIISGKTWSHI